MKLYVVEGNTYLDEYGDCRNIFGIYDDKELANNRVEEMKAELYAEIKPYQTCIIKSIDDIEVAIVEVELNKPVNECIGGYAE